MRGVVSFDGVRPRSLASEFEVLRAPILDEDPSQEGPPGAGSMGSGAPEGDRSEAPPRETHRRRRPGDEPSPP